MDGGEPDRWSEVAVAWSELWGDLPRPLWDVVARRTGLGPGRRVLDAGCGSGDMLAHLAGTGAGMSGFDPAAGMVTAARRRAPGADIRRADLSAVPWADATFDVVVAVNAVQFADDVDAAVAELVRVCRPGGAVVLAGWAEDARNDLARVESAVAAWHQDDVPPDGPLRLAGGLGSLLRASGAEVEAEDVVELPWLAADDTALVRGVLLGEDDDVVERLTETVLAAAAPFRRPEGYVLVNAFRYALARRPG
jgi:SAM-dependent methyltransferase